MGCTSGERPLTLSTNAASLGSAAVATDTAATTEATAKAAPAAADADRERPIYLTHTPGNSRQIAQSVNSLQPSSFPTHQFDHWERQLAEWSRPSMLRNQQPGSKQ